MRPMIERHNIAVRRSPDKLHPVGRLMLRYNASKRLTFHVRRLHIIETAVSRSLQQPHCLHNERSPFEASDAQWRALEMTRQHHSNNFRTGKNSLISTPFLTTDISRDDSVRSASVRSPSLFATTCRMPPNKTVPDAKEIEVLESFAIPRHIRSRSRNNVGMRNSIESNRIGNLTAPRKNAYNANCSRFKSVFENTHDFPNRKVNSLTGNGGSRAAPSFFPTEPSSGTFSAGYSVRCTPSTDDVRQHNLHIRKRRKLRSIYSVIPPRPQGYS